MRDGKRGGTGTEAERGMKDGTSAKARVEEEGTVVFKLLKFLTNVMEPFESLAEKCN